MYTVLLAIHYSRNIPFFDQGIKNSNYSRIKAVIQNIKIQFSLKPRCYNIIMFYLLEYLKY